MLPTLKNDVFLRALKRQAVPYTPVWLMRQAGRYLPEYRECRAQAGSFMGLASNPEYACEVTLQPIRRFDLDASILFADILLIPDAMGLDLSFVQGEGPKFANPVDSEQRVAELQAPDMEKLRYVFDAVTLIRQELGGKVPLIGFAGSPWTVACYMVEGGSTREYRKIKTMMYQRPDLLKQILEVTATATAVYLNEQIKAGAQAVMIFDSWGGVLPDGLFQQFSLAYTQKVIDQLNRQHEGEDIPVIAFTKGGGLWIKDIAATGADAVGLDWTMSLARARQETGDKVALQGNIDPMALFGSEESLRQEVRRVIDDFGPVGQGGHVFNLGHGISQFTNPEQVAVLVDEVHNHSKQYHN
ncbi:uroporphyrinogen decarboxylase [Oligella urethralis]|uniref:Uroporphyrinogen decarboxylase n=1 Tax=Oligella urethralis DNF00040 TaxID=1401065 RepID=A0A096APQ3_9BURK|nr:uroporphyrinogen decarboxylase [Oligella urethralis]KGF32607.1 uroporphyrinogen decarboxylase [Oligella urethralis DNF00040]PMC19357.1 uroporphyrinogen decarboxylase [Oligella urethralis]